jgi:hypothetical protein
MKKVIFIMLALAMTAGVSAQQKGGNRDVDNIVGGYQDGQHGMAGGHLKATTVLYTAEIELRPTINGAIGRKFDPETGTGFWNFK